MIKLTKCDYCDARFRVKKVLRPWIGYYLNKPVYHWHYVCLSKCGRINTIRYWCDHINHIYDKWVELGIKAKLEKRNPNYDQIVEEFESVKVELDRLNKQIEDELLKGNFNR